MRRILTAALAFCLLALVLTGCASHPEQLDFIAMDTQISLTVYGSREDAEAARSVISAVDAACSAEASDSEISALNQNGEAALSRYALEPLNTALAVWAETDGAFDCTVYPAVRAWGWPTGEYRVPDREERAALLPVIGSEKVTVQNDRVSLEPGSMVDLGGVAKGYAGTLAADALAKRGVTSALLSLGGNVQALGARPDGSPWRVGIRDPRSPEELLGVLRVTDTAVVTAGGYMRYFELDGVRYVHILDPKTAAPAETDLLSATVICPEGDRADALSTALYVMGMERARAFCEKTDTRAVLAGADGTVYVTEGLDFTAAEGTSQQPPDPAEG